MKKLKQRFKHWAIKKMGGYYHIDYHNLEFEKKSFENLIYLQEHIIPKMQYRDARNKHTLREHLASKLGLALLEQKVLVFSDLDDVTEDKTLLRVRCELSAYFEKQKTEANGH